jgi:outer membrane protein OmpA-like peptidoglycan-associated protein/tetratricopeptide (TPR) repeat protein
LIKKYFTLEIKSEMNQRTAFLFILIVFFAFSLKAQNLKKAEELYRNGYWATAIPAFEEALKKKDNIRGRSKLADCYRRLNKAEKAAALYKTLTTGDDVDMTDILRYGEVLMMQANYDSAKAYFTRFIELNPEDERGHTLLKSCETVKDLKPMLLDVEVTPFSLNTDADENAPVFFRDKLLFVSDREQGFKILQKKNETVGREYQILWSADRVTDTSFLEAKPYSSALSVVNQNTSSGSFTANGKEVFICMNIGDFNKKGTNTMQLYRATSKNGESWHNLERIPFCNEDKNYYYPSVSPDGKHLFFCADNVSNKSGLDIYVSHRTKKGWSMPTNLGEKVNSTTHDAFPFAAPNGKLYFSSKGHPGYGGWDIFVTEQDSAGTWKEPINMGQPFNSALDDISITFLDSVRGAFASARDGKGDDIYIFKIVGTKEGAPKLENKGEFVFSMNAEAVSSDDAFLNEEAKANTYTEQIKVLLKDKLLKKDQVFKIENITYAAGMETELSTTSASELDILAEFLMQNRSLKVELHIHTEGVGVTNPKQISDRRAKVIEEYLSLKGITSKRLTTKSMGNAHPLVDCKSGNCPPEEDLKNRRIELIIKDL